MAISLQEMFSWVREKKNQFDDLNKLNKYVMKEARIEAIKFMKEGVKSTPNPPKSTAKEDEDEDKEIKPDPSKSGAANAAERGAPTPGGDTGSGSELNEAAAIGEGEEEVHQAVMKEEMRRAGVDAKAHKDDAEDVVVGKSVEKAPETKQGTFDPQPKPSENSSKEESKQSESKDWGKGVGTALAETEKSVGKDAKKATQDFDKGSEEIQAGAEKATKQENREEQRAESVAQIATPAPSLENRARS